MTSGRDSVQETGQPPSAGSNPAEISSTAKTWVAVTGVLLVVWFFFAWLALDRHVLDAAGESLGTGFGLLVIVSVIGAMRRSRD